MGIFKAKRLTLITIVYWFLLSYVIVALVFWFISLQQQNENIASLRLQQLNAGQPSYREEAEKIFDAKRRKTAQYIGEGATFLCLIILSAIFIYRATRRQFNLSSQQQNFMMAVTHELKTPIAVTRLNLETLQKRRLEEQQQQKLVSNTLQEVERLNSLCNNILLASQLETGLYKVSKKEVDASALADRVVAEFKSRYPRRKFVSNIQNELFITGEELLIEMLMTNLIDNAVKYSPRETTVAITWESRKSDLVFSVADEGPGIPDEERNLIFEKFYRVGNEETRTAKGTGLGLYLCKKIAKDHNAEISVHNKLKGAVFTVIFKTKTYGKRWNQSEHTTG
jgi:signal transduction histidine kinase